MTRFSFLLSCLLACGTASATLRATEPNHTEGKSRPALKFEMQEIESGLKVGYAVILEDLNNDGKLDIIVVDTNRVLWYENPTWKRRTLLGAKTPADNVCITAIDITGDGHKELVLGSGWKPFDTQNPGTLHWLKRGNSLEDEWSLHPIPCEEPTVHRVRAIDLDGDGRQEIVHVPLMGRDATREKNWLDGRPVRIISYKIPAEPTKSDAWKPEILADSLHVTHNFAPLNWSSNRHDLIVASYEGVFIVEKVGERWTTRKIGTGNQERPDASRGASEVKIGSIGKPVIATIEPWHGHQVVVYTRPTQEGQLWERHVIDEQLRWGHAVAWADLDGDGTDELVIGVRDDPNPKLSDTHKLRRGVRLYQALDHSGKRWQRTLLEDGGVAVEDLAVGDLNGDGRPEIVAVGRATGNCRIYWNRTTR